ncbi:cytochrome P450 [Neofusicoccum parvum]|uniref:Cytochrome P450 n=1 Tax=Neofusicoccum parvum TaxID=310453 RepID=A0ACB5RUP5_9PEZI|nr:cytochrome P450 [Neofusicoccum parvum]
MLIDVASLIYSNVATANPSPSITIALLCLLMYAWRLWNFTLSPLLDNKRPEQIPYWIPFLGHSINFMQSTDRLIEYGLNLFRRSREPFAVKVLGEQVYAITSPEDAVLVYKCTTAFSWDVYLNKLLVGFGLRDDALKVAWHKPEPGEACYIHENPLNPQHKSMIHAIEDVYKQQLLPGDKLEEIIQMAIARMEDTLRWEQFLGPFLAGHTKTHKRISVAQFCRIKVTYITTGAMFGDAMFKLQPNLTELMMDLSDNAWALVFGYPKVLLPKKLKHAWKELCGTIRQFWQAPERDRADASWAINSIIQLQEQFEMDDESRDSLLAMISWAYVMLQNFP